MVRRTGLLRLLFKSDQDPSNLGLKSEVVAELGGSHEVMMEARPVNEHQSNSVVERVVQTVGDMMRTTSGRLNSRTARMVGS